MTDLEMENEFIIVLTTEADLEKAQDLSKTLLEKRYAACVSFWEIKSNFFWKGKLEQSKEVQLLIKTTKKTLQILLETIQKKHSYQIPELIYWKASASNSYGTWLDQVTNSKNIF